MQPVDATPEEQKENDNDPKPPRNKTRTSQPMERPGDGAAGSGRNFFLLAAFIQKERRDAGITQLPNGAIEDEMMQVHECREGQKTGDKIGVEQAADDPWSGHKERDSTCNQCQQIAGETPGRLSGGASFLSLEVAGDPKILRRV